MRRTEFVACQPFKRKSEKKMSVDSYLLAIADIVFTLAELAMVHVLAKNTICDKRENSHVNYF